MARYAGAVLTVMIAFGLFATTPALSLAEQATGSPVATPVGGPMLSLNLGPGIVVKPLALGAADQLPGTGSLTLEQVNLGPGATSGLRELLAPELVVVQSGRLTVTDSLGISATLRPGQQELGGTNGSYEASNDTASDVTFLRLRLKDTQPFPAGPSTPVVATPVAQASVSVLFQGKNDRLPSASGLMFIAAATFRPGADSGNRTGTGPLGIAATSGTLGVGTTTGIQGQLPAGKGVVLPAGIVYRFQNQSGSAVNALIAGVATPTGPVSQPVVQPPSPTAAPSKTPPPTAAPVIPTAPSTPAQGQSGSVLYQADWSQGLNGWSGGPNWKGLNGMAVSDGTVSQGTPYTLTAPFLPGTQASYAEEADIQFIRFPQYPSGCPTFGMDARVSPTTWYSMTITPDSEQCYQSANTYGRNTISIASVTCDQSGNNCQPTVLISTAFTVDTNWHTYRFELNGNNLRVLIDGHVVLVTQDNLILTPGKVGLSSYYTQVNVRSFRVIALK